MTSLQEWSLIVGFFLPPVLAVVQQTSWATQIRAFVTFLACAVAGAGVAYFAGDLTGKRFVESALVVLVTTIAVYTGAWKPGGIAPAIERATNFGKNP